MLRGTGADTNVSQANNFWQIDNERGIYEDLSRYAKGMRIH